MDLERMDDFGLDRAVQENENVRTFLAANRGFDRRSREVIMTAIAGLLATANALQSEAHRRVKHAAEREAIEAAARAST